MKNIYKYIVFDFDGVVCDSTNECMVTAWNSWEKFNMREGFRLKVNDFNKNDIKKFRDLRPYVRGASEYYVLMNSIESKIKIKDQKDPDVAYHQLIRPGKSKLGLFYIEKKNFFLDLKLIVITLIAIYSKKYALKHLTQVMKKLGASIDLIEIASRKQKLTPSSPPGTKRIITSRDIKNN